MKKNTIIVVSTLLFLFMYSFSFSQEKTIEKSFDGVKEIKANFGSGDLFLQKGSSETVIVKLVYTYDNDRFTPEIDQNGSRLVLKEKYFEGSSNGWGKWTLVIPDGLNIITNSGSGDINTNGTTINLESNSGSGDIDFNNVNGSLEVNSGSGNLELTGHKGNVRVNTGSGDINVSDSEGELHANTGSGDVELREVSGSFRINTGSGDISCDMLVIQDESNFNSGSGNTEVSLGQMLAHDINLNSGSGNSVLDFNGFEISGDITMKANKRNGEIIAPFEFTDVEEEDQGGQTIVKKMAHLGESDNKIKVGTGSGKAIIRK